MYCVSRGLFSLATILADGPANADRDGSDLYFLRAKIIEAISRIS
jgi:hypothetical protein